MEGSGLRDRSLPEGVEHSRRGLGEGRASGQNRDPNPDVLAGRRTGFSVEANHSGQGEKADVNRNVVPTSL